MEGEVVGLVDVVGLAIKCKVVGLVEVVAFAIEVTVFRVVADLAGAATVATSPVSALHEKTEGPKSISTTKF